MLSDSRVVVNEKESGGKMSPVLVVPWPTERVHRKLSAFAGATNTSNKITTRIVCFIVKDCKVGTMGAQ